MHVTDGSPSSVARWAEAGMFADHAAHVTTGVCDAQTPDAAADGPLRAVFANYVLDSLPAAVLRWSAGGWQQLCARASIRARRHAASLAGRSRRRVAAQDRRRQRNPTSSRSSCRSCRSSSPSWPFSRSTATGRQTSNAISAGAEPSNHHGDLSLRGAAVSRCAHPAAPSRRLRPGSRLRRRERRASIRRRAALRRRDRDAAQLHPDRTSPAECRRRCRAPGRRGPRCTRAS